jgi:hypothetical protein
VAWADVVVPGEAPRAARRQAARAIVLAALAAWCASLALAVAMPAFFGTDEPAHLGYVAVLERGRLPEVDTALPSGQLDELDRLLEHYERVGTPEDRRDVWVANHPPAHYALSLPVVVAGTAIDGDRGPLLAMRLVSSIAIALTVVATGALGARLLPGRPSAAVGAAILVAALGQVAHVGALAYSDALGVLGWTLCLVIAVTVLRRAPAALDARLAWVSAAVVALATATRASTVPAAAVVLIAWAVACGQAHRSGRAVRPAIRGLLLTAVVPAVLAGPFYVRNRALYGSVTADRYLLVKFDREPGRGVVAQLRAPELYEQIVEDLFGRLRERVTLGDGLGVRVVAAVVVVAGVAALLSLRTRPWRPSLPGVLVAGLGAAASIALLVAVARFRAAGGNLHVRYLVPAVPLVAVAVAGGLTRLGRRPVLLAPAVAAVAVVQGVLLWRYLELLEVTPSVAGLAAPAWAPPVSAALVVAWALLLVGATGLALTRPSADTEDQRLAAATSEESSGAVDDHQR